MSTAVCPALFVARRPRPPPRAPSRGQRRLPRRRDVQRPPALAFSRVHVRTAPEQQPRRHPCPPPAPHAAACSRSRCATRRGSAPRSNSSSASRWGPKTPRGAATSSRRATRRWPPLRVDTRSSAPLRRRPPPRQRQRRASRHKQVRDVLPPLIHGVEDGADAGVGSRLDHVGSPVSRALTPSRSPALIESNNSAAGIARYCSAVVRAGAGARIGSPLHAAHDGLRPQSVGHAHVEPITGSTPGWLVRCGCLHG